MKSYWDKLEDSINPICFNDIRKTVKANDFWMKLLFLLSVYLFVFFVLIVGTSKHQEPYILNCYRVLAFFSLVAIIAIPLEIRKLSLFEVSNDNIFFIFMSNITASKFIRGKMLLGLIYLFIFIIFAIPVYLYICLVGAIDFFRLLRIFFFNCLIPIPTILFCIYEGVKDGRGSKIAISANNLMIFLAMLFDGLIYIRLFMVEFIRDLDPKPVLLLIDLGLGFVCLIIALFTYLFLYSHLIKTYPLSEASVNDTTKIRKAFRYKPVKAKIQKSSNLDINISSPIVSDKKVIDEAPKVVHQEIKEPVDIVVDKEKINKTSNIDNLDIGNTDKKIKSSPIISSPDLEVYQKLGNRIRKPKKSKTSPESQIKILFTVIWVFALFLIFTKTFIAFLLIHLNYFLFVFLSAYLHSRDKIYDNRSKLEIPANLMEKLIRFPFSSGYVNGIAWLTLIGFSYMFVLFITFGLFEPRAGMAYYTRDVLPGGYYVMLGFMLNISSWCFVGRFIAENFLKYDPKDNKVLPTIIVLIVAVAFCTGLLPKEPKHLNLFNYFLPTMPSLIDYHFFKKPLAFLCNFFFFVVTIIPHFKSMAEQAHSYFTYEPDSDDIYS